MKHLLLAASVLALTAGAAAAETFNRVASFATPDNMADGEDRTRESSAEIVAASGDGMTLAYTDSPLGVLGVIDITDPAAPAPLGNIDLGAAPTAVSVLGNTAFVAINTGDSFTSPTGVLRAYDLTTKALLGECDLGGQPDSTAIAPDGNFIAIAIENERDEDAGDGRVPQLPGGFVVMFDITEAGPACDTRAQADLTGIAEIAPEDPEPEFVDISPAGEVAVTLQENNHIAVIARDGTVTGHFSAGAVDLVGVDLTDEQAAILPVDTVAGVLREPDALQWIDADHFAVANEGDMDGGSRGWTIFRKDGTVVYESGMAFEHAVIEAGHYPDRRSDAKGVEPEGMEFAVIDGVPMVFLLAERASVVGVYDVSNPAEPRLHQILPSGVSPEGAVAIPSRGILATANEVDLGADGLMRAHVMVYAWQDGPAAYPTLTSAGAGSLIGWGAISGMVAGEGRTIYAVNDSFYGYQPTIFTIDASAQPARITAALPITRRNGDIAQKLDVEGITLDGEGGFWLAAEGRSDRLIPHALYHVDAEGVIRQEIALPEALLDQEIRFGFEGITKVGDVLWMAIQREWQDDAENTVKLLAYNTESQEWGAVLYPKEAPAGAGWVGLSEITAHGDWVYIVERDNQVGGAAALKQITRVALAQMVPAALDGELPVVTKEVWRDLIPDLARWGGFTAEKVEGLAITADGEVFVSTDNDGVDDSSGETFFWSAGSVN
jgi:hypothetical protein